MSRGVRDGRHEHPYLVPWNQLPDERREIDRVLVKSLTTLVTSAGLSVDRLQPIDDLNRAWNASGSNP
jgi:hypothetical protein